MRFYASTMPLHPTKCEKGPRIASRPSKKDGFSARSTDGAARLNPSERWTNRRAPRWVQLERMLNRTSRASGASASTAASSDLPSTASGCFGLCAPSPFSAIAKPQRSRAFRCSLDFSAVATGAHATKPTNRKPTRMGPETKPRAPPLLYTALYNTLAA